MILRNRSFRLLWLAGLMSYVGNWSLFAALPLFVFQLTGSTFASGVVLTAMFLPLLLGSVAGVFVDRWDRQRTLLIGNLTMAVLVLPMLITATGHGLWVAYVVVIVVGLASQFTTVAENALLPRLVGRRAPAGRELAELPERQPGSDHRAGARWPGRDRGRTDRCRDHERWRATWSLPG